MQGQRLSADGYRAGLIRRRQTAQSLSEAKPNHAAIVGLASTGLTGPRWQVVLRLGVAADARVPLGRNGSALRRNPPAGGISTPSARRGGAAGEGSLSNTQKIFPVTKKKSTMIIKWLCENWASFPARQFGFNPWSPVQVGACATTMCRVALFAAWGAPASSSTQPPSAVDHPRDDRGGCSHPFRIRGTRTLYGKALGRGRV